MEAKQIAGGILSVILILGGAYYGYTQYMSGEEQQNQLDFDHSFPSHDGYFETVEYADKEDVLSYNKSLTEHNRIMGESSYSFTYTRSYEGGSIDLDMTVNRDTNKVEFTNNIVADQEITQEGYYEKGSRYMRLRQGNNPDSWQYQSQDTSFDNVSKTGFNELDSFQVSGSTFEYSGSTERNGVTYYIYEPRIVDEKEFRDNSWKGVENPESVSIEGEILLSEYGVVTSAYVEYTVNDIVVTSTYQIKNFGETSIEEPIWITEARNPSEDN